MSYQVVRADIERDKETILQFWRENNPKALDSKYRWIYENNPAGKPLVWTVRHVESGECVGMTALFPRRMSTRNGTILAGVTGDLLVNRKHRTLGPAVKLLRNTLTAVQDGAVDLIYTFPNPAADGVARAAGYRRLGRLVRLVKVLRTTRHLRNLGLPGLLAAALGPLVDLFLRITSTETWTANHQTVECRETSEVDGRFRTLWGQRNRLIEIAGERTEDYLRWKFLRDPDDVNRIYAAFDSASDALLAYLVYRPIEHGVEIREFIVGQDERAGSILMANFLQSARRQGLESVTVQMLENTRLIGEFSHFGFRERGEGRQVYMSYSERMSGQRDVLAGVNNWLLMASDQDT